MKKKPNLIQSIKLFGEIAERFKAEHVEEKFKKFFVNMAKTLFRRTE